MTKADLRNYIIDPVAFTRDLLGLQPDPLQAEVLNSHARRGILCCTRQWGNIAAAKAVHQAFLHPRNTIRVSGPCERQSALLVRKCADMLLTLGLPKRGDGHNRISLQLPNGSRIIGLPHTESNIRGFSAPSLILIDEAAVVHDSIYHALVPMQATNDGALWLLSTPREKRGFFYNEWIASDTDWHKIRATALDCPRISPAWLERRARRLPKAAFEQEFLCVFRSSQLSLFQDEDLQAALAPPPTLDRPVRVYLGLDLGQRHDHSALAVLYLQQYYTGRIDPGTRVREVRHILQLKTIKQIPLETPYPGLSAVALAKAERSPNRPPPAPALRDRRQSHGHHRRRRPRPPLHRLPDRAPAPCQLDQTQHHRHRSPAPHQRHLSGHPSPTSHQAEATP
ncbi:MAG: terminase family protein [Bryobacterales bacterium]|nr:terminase family protein [Bryobacterales bacterium]